MSSRRSSATPSRSQLLDELDARLRILTAEELRAAILGHAERLAQRDRTAFLAIFPEAVSKSPAHGRQPGEDTDSDLIGDIDTFTAQLDDSDSSDEWAWDRDDGDDHWDDSSGPNSGWPEEMDDLFRRAAESFVRGDLNLARVAYWRLLHVFLDGHEAFGDSETPEDLVETDLREATACYLRALYETVPPDERAARLFEELRELEYVGGLVTLADVAGTRREALPELEAFLPDWLRRLAAAPHDWLRYRGRSLLVEAARLHRGHAGLADLARARVDDLPQLMLDWVDALEADGCEDDAIAACREGLERIEDRSASEVRAQLADRLAIVAGRRRLADVTLEARRTAWRSGPSQRRLLELVAAANQLSVTQEVIDAEADRADDCSNPRLACAVLLLAGRVEPAIVQMYDARPLGWSHSDHPGPVVVPYLLVAATGGDAPLRRTGSALGQLFAEMDVRRLIGPGPDLDELMALDENLMPGDRPLLAELLATRVAAQHASDHERERWFTAALATIQRRTAAVVEGKQRGAYARVAMLVVAAAESLMQRGGSGANLIAETLSRYPRHTAFRREVDEAVHASPLLPPSASQPRRYRS